MPSTGANISRWQAERARVLALGRSNNPSAAHELLPFLKSDSSETRRLAASGLRKLAPVTSDATTVAIALREPALRDPHPQVQQYALKALALYPQFAVLYLKDLKDLARDPTKVKYVREAAADAIEKIQIHNRKTIARKNHWCARCHRTVSEEEFFEGMRVYGHPYCRHCFDEKQLEDKNFESTVEGAKRRRTEDGTCVQSVGEKRIADFLAAHNIKYYYDDRIRIAGDARIRPDFYLPEFDLYIEYWGMNTPEYNDNKLQKRILYQRAKKKLISLSYKELDRLEDVLAEKLSHHMRL